MHLQFARHATFILTFSGRNFLVDPMLSAAGAMDPIANTPNQARNPLVNLPWNDDELASRLAMLDGLLITHTHQDHWDPKARELLKKDLPLFCQPEDLHTFGSDGFIHAQAIESALDWEGITITRTGGRHGSGALGDQMGPVSGFILHAEGEPTCYIGGDTIWCETVVTVLMRQKPEVVVVNAGAAQFLEGGPITMDSSDVIKVCRTAPEARVVAVHMGAINHCVLTREALRGDLAQQGFENQVDIPTEGELIKL